MKNEHKYAQALRWVAEGQSVECRQNEGSWGLWPESFDDRKVAMVVDGNSGFEFRLKPRFLKIGNREVEAPLIALKKGDVYFYWDYAHFEVSETEFYGSGFDVKCVASGRAFSSENACRAAHDAIHALLTGKESA